MDWHERLAHLYNLMPCEQDLGIINANGDRLDEFLDIFLNHNAEDEWEWEELADLVFESANDVILEGGLTQEQEKKIVSIINQKEKYPTQFEYWMRFGNELDYPVKKLIKRADV